MYGSTAVFLISVLVTLTIAVQPTFAVDQNGVIEMPFTENPPAIDGEWTTPDEWSDASVHLAHSSGGNEFYILAKHDRENLYLLVDLINEQVKPSKESKIFAFPPYDDDGENVIAYNLVIFCFDTNNDGGSVLQNDDFCFEAYHDYYDETWKSIALKGSGTDDREKISFPSRAKISWAFSSENDPYEPGRPHNIYEAKFPLSFLHKSDSYGFYVLSTAGWLGSDRMYFWPKGHNLFNDGYTPSAFGSIISPENTISAPLIPIISVSADTLEFGNVAISEKSSPRSITIKNIGTSLLKINSIRASGEFSVSSISTPTQISPNEELRFDVTFAPIRTGEKTGTVTISSNDLEKSSFQISVKGNAVEKGQIGGCCLIATAAYGTELAPQVQMLRELRDSTVMETSSGTTFVTAFNAFYYSFSPTVADWERQSPAFKEAVRVVITPMLSTLSILNYVEIDSEQDMLGYGVGIILLNLGMYFAVPALVILRIRRTIL